MVWVVLLLVHNSVGCTFVYSKFRTVGQPKVQLQHILFFDIETVPIVPFYEDLKEGLQVEWQRKARNLKNYAVTEDATVAQLFEQRAGVYSEFSKVVAIGFGAAYFKEEEWHFAYKCLAGDDEKALLNQFCHNLTKFNKKISRDLVLCGHNIKEFDIPFLARRMLINRMTLPDCLQLHHKKPWEMPHLDTMELWKFGDYKAYTSLNLLAAVFDIPSPKSDIDGSQVAAVYYKEKDWLKKTKVYTSALKDLDMPEDEFITIPGGSHNTVNIDNIYLNKMDSLLR